MPEIIEFEVEGLNELVKKLDGNVLLAGPIRGFFKNSLGTMKREISALTPVDVGILKDSIGPTYDTSPIPQYGLVGTPSKYALHVEYDTKPHWPPIAAITPWGIRHHMVPFLVARGIARHGTKGKHMFSRGLEASKNAIAGFLAEAGKAIEQIWGSK